MKVAAPNAAQKRWREEVRAIGAFLDRKGPVEIHHCAGRTAVHNKVHIGHWWILPLTDQEHRDIHRIANRKEREKELFFSMLETYGWCTRYGPPPEVLAAIREYRR